MVAVTSIVDREKQKILEHRGAVLEFAIWKDDPDVPIFKHVKAEFGRLQ
jgi:hypothetical protein